MQECMMEDDKFTVLQKLFAEGRGDWPPVYKIISVLWELLVGFLSPYTSRAMSPYMIKELVVKSIKT